MYSIEILGDGVNRIVILLKDGKEIPKETRHLSQPVQVAFRVRELTEEYL